MTSAKPGDTRCSLRLAALAFATVVSTPALAGGPLYVVPSDGMLLAARWQSPVKVYTDLGDLGGVNNATANALVANAIQQWSQVPTSSFRAVIAGSMADAGIGDVTGANAGQVIGVENGGGIHVIYDHDGSVMADFFGIGFGVLGIATPEFLAAEGSTEIVEGWMVLAGQPEWLEQPEGGPTSGVIAHEFGHAINLAHAQTNGWLHANQPIPAWGYAAGSERAGPDQCTATPATWPTADQVETMYPFIGFYPWDPLYNSPQMATIDHPDDHAALSSIYPKAGYAQQTGTLKGRIVAKDGGSELTGINVIARRVGAPFDALSRISGDRTQGLLGPDGTFELTGLTPGAAYVVHVDQIAQGGFSTPKAILLGPEEYWNARESGDATVDDACASTPITVAAGETRVIEIAINGIDKAPTFVHLPYVMPYDVSDNGRRIVGMYGGGVGPFWMHDRNSRTIEHLGGNGNQAVVSGNGSVVAGSITVPQPAEWGGIVDQERAAIWSQGSRTWQTIAGDDLQGCDAFHTSSWDVDFTGSTVVGLAWDNCRDVFAFRWTKGGGFERLPASGGGNTRANAVSGDGKVAGGWEELPQAEGQRIGTLWKDGSQLLLRDPDPASQLHGYVGEVMAINDKGDRAVGLMAGTTASDSWMWTAADGVRNIGRHDGQFCYIGYDWETGEPYEECVDRWTDAFSMSDDGGVVAGASRVLWAGINDAAIYTPRLGWMLLADFLAKQGVLEGSRWQFLGAKVAANGRTLTGWAHPLGTEAYHGFRVDLDQVYVCSRQGDRRRSQRVQFPKVMDERLARGDAFGLCPGDKPL
jgi:hypothetical protein